MYDISLHKRGFFKREASLRQAVSRMRTVEVPASQGEETAGLERKRDHGQEATVELEHEKMRKWAAKGYRLWWLLPRFKSPALEQKFTSSSSFMLAQRRGLAAGCFLHLVACVWQWQVRQRELRARQWKQRKLIFLCQTRSS